MALYLIGDLQGCDAPLQQLLRAVDFSASRDTLYVLGDLVNRGPQSLDVLRRLAALEGAAQCVLGNHDLHLLALWQGEREPSKSDTAQSVLAAPDAPALLHWLRHRPLAVARHGWLMVHAGVLPQWSPAQVTSLAAEVEHQLRGPLTELKSFLQGMYGDRPVQWHNGLAGLERSRVIVNALTRLRFCTPEGEMEFSCSGDATQAPEGYMPWFECPQRATAGVPIAFGHWSTLLKGPKPLPTLLRNTLPLDTGCVWGGWLTAAKMSELPGAFEVIQVRCQVAQPVADTPG